MHCVRGVLCLLAVLGLTGRAFADEAKLGMPWLMIGAEDEHEFVKTAGGPSDRQIWTWHPKMQFMLQGDNPSGVSFSVKFTAGGKAWAEVPCEDLNGTWTCQKMPPEKWSRETGMFGFELWMKNALAGTDAVFYSGTFKVGKYFDGRPAPAYAKEDKNCFEYYVDHDWALPFGFVTLWTGQNSEPLGLRAFMWFKFGYPEPSRNEITSHVFYKGAEVCKTESSDGEQYLSEAIDVSDTKGNTRWTRRMLYLDDCKAKVQNPSMYPKAFQLDKNPGEYEIKVLVKGQLARVAKFTINPDGTLADPIGKVNPMNTSRAILPVKVVSTQLPYDKEAWKTGMLYGNPLKDFVAP